MKQEPKKPESTAPTVEPEFRRVVKLQSIGVNETTMTFTANPSECEALATRYGVLSISALEATVRLWRKGAGARARVHFVADVVQSCIVTLEPVDDHVDQEIEMDFLPQGVVDPADRAGDSALVIEFLDTERFVGGTLDLGSVISEYLSLAIDPYPRKSGVEFGNAERDGAEAVDTARRSPFSALSNLFQENKGKT